MKHGLYVVVLMAGILLSPISFATPENCPDPQTTSLKWGVPPAPWVLSPLSDNNPYVDDSTVFVRANILAVNYGLGVTCTYKTADRYFSIWWQVLVRLPIPNDIHWISNMGGYVCTDDRTDCTFYVALER